MAFTALDHFRRRSSRSRALTWSSIAPRRRVLLLHLAILTAAVLFAAAQATGGPLPLSPIAAGGAERSAETESSSKPTADRSPSPAPPAASKRQRTRPAQKDRVLPNPPEYPPLGRELA